MSVLVVTGTGTEVGKTIVTAAIAATASRVGKRVAVVKAAQTGVSASAESDLDVVTRLSGVTDVHELVRYPAPLAPASAARLAGLPELPVEAMVVRIRALADRDLVVVEGAGGVLVRLDSSGATVADLARQLDAPTIVVTPAGLGSLNSTALTCEALRARAVDCPGIVIGSWPETPDLAAFSNLDDLAEYGGAPLIGRLPERLDRLSAAEFGDVVSCALSHPVWASLIDAASAVQRVPAAAGERS
jgi:dethiobiotin synthetase